MPFDRGLLVFRSLVFAVVGFGFGLAIWTSFGNPSAIGSALITGALCAAIVPLSRWRRPPDSALWNPISGLYPTRRPWRTFVWTLLLAVLSPGVCVLAGAVDLGIGSNDSTVGLALMVTVFGLMISLPSSVPFCASFSLLAWGFDRIAAPRGRDRWTYAIALGGLAWLLAGGAVVGWGMHDARGEAVVVFGWSIVTAGNIMLFAGVLDAFLARLRLRRQLRAGTHRVDVALGRWPGLEMEVLMGLGKADGVLVELADVGEGPFREARAERALGLVPLPQSRPGERPT